MIYMRNVIYSYLLSCAFFIFPSQDTRIIETNYGPVTLHEKVLLDLFDHSAMQRLKKIHQYGVGFYITTNYEYHRFEHSVGVFTLLRKFGAPLEEQIAGLLHDVSHTIFSHVGDFLFKTRIDGDSYQDEIHEWYLTISGLGRVLESHGLTVRDVMHKNGTFLMLERDLPDICADRLEYILQGAFLEGTLSQGDIQEILDALRFENGEWFFVHTKPALKLARASLYLTQHLFATPQNYVSYRLAAQMIEYAIDNEILTLDDVHFGFDDEVWQTLCQHKDQKIQSYVAKLHNLSRTYSRVDKQDPTGSLCKSKFRGINPWVKVEDALIRLTDLDSSFAEEFFALKDELSQGLYLKFL